MAVSLSAFEMQQMFGRQLVDFVKVGDAAGALGAAGGDNVRLNAALRGKVVFENAGRCTSCHVGPNFTDEMLHNTGLALTGEPSRRGRIKTPTLRGIRFTAPYFHDGSAETLDDVLRHYVAGKAHPAAIGTPDFEFRATPLTSGQLSDLKIYLESL